MGTPPITPPPPITPGAAPAPRGWWSRNWKWFVPVGCLTLLLLIFLFIGAIMMMVFGAMKSSDVYAQALDRARNHPQVQEALGTPIEDGMFVTGSVNVSGTSGKADLTIPIKGPKGEGAIYLDAVKFAGEWEYRRLEVGVEGQPRRINLLPPEIQEQ